MELLFLNFKDFGVFFKDIVVIPRYDAILNDLEDVAFVKNLKVAFFLNTKLMIRGKKIDHTVDEQHMEFEILFDDVIFKKNDHELAVYMKRGKINLPPVAEILHLQIFNEINKDPFRIPTFIADIFYEHFELIVKQSYTNDLENDIQHIFAAMTKRGKRNPKEKLTGGVLETYIHSMPAYTVTDYGKEEIALHGLETFWGLTVTQDDDSKVHEHSGKLTTEVFKFSKASNEFVNNSWESTFPAANGYLDARFLQEFDEEKDIYYKNHKERSSLLILS